MRHPGLYIHIPFCSSKCPYCGFYSIPSTSLIPQWLEALKGEILRYKDLFKESFDTLYMGGGTPSILNTDQLRVITDSIFSCYQFDGNAEIAIEVNPGDVDSYMAGELKAMGFNRVNLGVQSFNDDELLFLGRRHGAGEAESAIEGLRESGFENIGIDLIYGLQGQSMEAWRANLDRALAFHPEHISCYQLSIEKGTVFANMKERGIIEPVKEEMEEAFFLATSEYLEDRGYIHYEISNFAKGEPFYSRHNCKYWDHTPYLGLGPSAHSFDCVSRWWNFRSVRKYIEALNKGEGAVEEHEDLTDEQIMMEKISLGLRTIWGFEMKVLPPKPAMKDIVSRLEDAGYIKVRGERITPTKKGFMVADHLPLYFFE
jgi:putative oxygen-independent coproporphyrinogen III oxidase